MLCPRQTKCLFAISIPSCVSVIINGGTANYSSYLLLVAVDYAGKMKTGATNGVNALRLISTADDLAATSMRQ